MKLRRVRSKGFDKALLRDICGFRIGRKLLHLLRQVGKVFNTQFHHKRTKALTNVQFRPVERRKMPLS